MIGAWLGLAAGTALFFGGVYRLSRSDSWKAAVWGVLSVLGLLMAGIAVLRILVPGFFAAAP